MTGVVGRTEVGGGGGREDAFDVVLPWTLATAGGFELVRGWGGGGGKTVVVMVEGAVAVGANMAKDDEADGDDDWGIMMEAGRGMRRDLR